MSVLFFFAIPPGISLLILIAGAADKARPPPHTLAYLTFIREMSFAMSEYKKPYINLCPLRNVPFFCRPCSSSSFSSASASWGKKKLSKHLCNFLPLSTPLLFISFFCFYFFFVFMNKLRRIYVQSLDPERKVASGVLDESVWLSLMSYLRKCSRNR